MGNEAVKKFTWSVAAHGVFLRIPKEIKIKTKNSPNGKKNKKCLIGRFVCLIKLNDDDAFEPKDLLKETSSVKESIDVNGFQVLPSQVEFVSLVFKKYPDIALELQAKNESLRTAGMYVFLSLIKTLCKSLQELSSDDLIQADNALTFLKCSGIIKVDWLEHKLEQVKVKKKQEQVGETRMQELEEELNGVKQNCSDIEV
ncbi:unnamed protein product [Arabis nemorensis]|uniref:MATH domain-containing protein n=1 Tax=Arabis nemorensis TaxID=586526 RepID=A0A565BXR1_9BRAS|nr:unnamed protein product [Arabis nemorensis]